MSSVPAGGRLISNDAIPPTAITQGVMIMPKVVKAPRAGVDGIDLGLRVELASITSPIWVERAIEQGQSPNTLPQQAKQHAERRGGRA